MLQISWYNGIKVEILAFLCCSLEFYQVTRVTDVVIFKAHDVNINARTMLFSCKCFHIVTESRDNSYCWVRCFVNQLLLWMSQDLCVFLHIEEKLLPGGKQCVYLSELVKPQHKHDP